jgi:hypothetical protein
VAETIKEFLVSLGFKTDENTLKKFDEGVTKATKAVIALAAAVEATATGVALGMERFAANLSSLYYEAQRVGSSARELKALDIAAQNLGANAGEAGAAVDAMQLAIATSPGNLSVLQSVLARLGFTMKRSADGTWDYTDAFIKLVRVARSEGPDAFYAVNLLTSMLGVQAATLNKLVHGDLLEQYIAALKELGPGFDAAAKNAAKFMQQWRLLATQFQSIGADVFTNVVKAFGFKDLQDFDKWLQEHHNEIVRRITDAIRDIVAAAQWLIREVITLTEKFEEWDRKSGGLLGKLTLIALALKVTGAGSIIGGVLSLTGGLLRLAGAAGAATTALGTLLVAGAGLAGWKAGEWLKPKIDALVNKAAGTTGETLGTWLQGFANRQSSIGNFLGSTLGLNAAQTSGVLSRLYRESHYSASAVNQQSGAYGLAQWLGPRVQEFARVMGKPLQGSSIDDQMRFLMYELQRHPEYGLAQLRQARSAEEAYDIFTHMYERPGAADEAATGKAGRARAVAIQSTIHVHGVTDPQAVKDKIVAQQQDDYATAMRGLLMGAQ